MQHRHRPGIRPSGLRILFLAILLVIVGPGTSSCSRGHTVKVVKRKKHYGWFDGKKDRGKKRTKTVKYKRKR